MPKRTLVLGGIRSGKSAYAEDLINGSPEVQFIATTVLNEADPTFAKRIEVHRARRPHNWTTLETTVGLASALRQPPAPVLIDDLGGWLTAMLDEAHWSADIGASVDELIDALKNAPVDVVIVSPEVGLSVVPSSAAGRRFADELGLLNQKVAALCETVTMVEVGIPRHIKGGQ